MTRFSFLIVLAACGSSAPSPKFADATKGPLSLAADARMVTIGAGRFVAGSTPEERDQAYDDYHLTSGTDAARASHLTSTRPT